MILGFNGCCSLTRSAQCGACGPSHEIAFACRVVLLSVNALPPLFESWHELDLLRRMVRSELARQCELQGAGIEDCLCGVVGYSVIYAEVHGELDLVSWDVDNAYLLLQAPSTWVEFAFVLSYSGLPVYVPSCSSVGDIYTLSGDYRSGAGSVLECVWGVSWGVSGSSCSSWNSFGIYLPNDGFEPPTSVKLRVDFAFLSLHLS